MSIQNRIVIHSRNGRRDIPFVSGAAGNGITFRGNQVLARGMNTYNHRAGATLCYFDVQVFPLLRLALLEIGFSGSIHNSGYNGLT